MVKSFLVQPYFTIIRSSQKEETMEMDAFMGIADYLREIRDLLIQILAGLKRK